VRKIKMQNRLHPILQAILLVIIPVVVLYIINQILALTGKLGDSSPLTSTLRMLIFVIPSALYIILHKYKLSYWGLIITGLATILFVRSLPVADLENNNIYLLYIMNFLYFGLFLGLTYLAYFLVNGFKLKNLVFIVGGVMIHTISLMGILLINKEELYLARIKQIIHSGFNLYLMIGLALALGLLLFELPQAQTQVAYDYGDDDL